MSSLPGALVSAGGCSLVLSLIGKGLLALSICFRALADDEFVGRVGWIFKGQVNSHIDADISSSTLAEYRWSAESRLCTEHL